MIKGYSVAEARALLPDRAGIQLSIHKDTSWVVKAPYRVKTSRSHTVAFGDWANNRPALLNVLRWILSVENEISPTTVCPYDFES